MRDHGNYNKKRFSKPYKKRFSYRRNLQPLFLGVAMLFIMADFLSSRVSFGNGFAAPSFSTASCNIKGNISYNSGRKIFHVPGQENYRETIISSSRGERWFCSEAAARAAGWRKARR